LAKKLVKRKALYFLRKHGELDTTQLKDYINSSLKYGTTSSELGNILGNNREFVKIRREKRVSAGGRCAGSYDVWVWKCQIDDARSLGK